MGLSDEFSCETGSFFCCRNTHRFFQSEVLRLYFPSTETWVVRSVSLPSCSSQFISTQMWDHQLCQPLPHPPGPPATALPRILSALAAHLYASYWSGWMFLLYLLGYWTSIQFDLLSVLVAFVFKFVVILLLVVRGGTVYLPTPPSWPEVS